MIDLDLLWFAVHDHLFCANDRSPRRLAQKLHRAIDDLMRDRHQLLARRALINYDQDAEEGFVFTMWLKDTPELVHWHTEEGLDFALVAAVACGLEIGGATDSTHYLAPTETITCPKCKKLLADAKTAYQQDSLQSKNHPQAKKTAQQAATA